MLGDEDLIAIGFREHRARVEAHADRRHVGPKLPRRRREFRAGVLLAEFRIGDPRPVAIREAEIHPRLRRVVQLVRRHVVPQHVAPVVGKPELVRLRVPVEADRVADPPLDDLRFSLGRKPADGAIDGIGLLADVAGHPLGHVELAVRAEADEFPSVVPVARIGVANHHRLGRIHLDRRSARIGRNRISGVDGQGGTCRRSVNPVDADCTRDSERLRIGIVRPLKIGDEHG